MRVILLGVVLAIAAAAPANSFADDKQIAEFIKAKLVQEKQRGNLYGFNVDMRVDRGTVWFKGFVSNRNQELMILRTAQLAGHLGVVQVVDDIEVNQPSGPMVSQPMPPQMQPVQQRQSIMTSTQNPFEMQPTAPMQSYMPPRPMPPRMQQPMPQMPLPQQSPQTNSSPAPSRHNMPMSMPVSKLENDEENETQKVAYQQTVEQADEPNQSPFSQERPDTPFASGPGIYQSDQTSFQDNLSKTVPASAAVPASAPPAGPPLPFARAATPTGGTCQGGVCSVGCDTGCAGCAGCVGGFAGAGFDSGSANLPGYAWPSYAAHPNYGAVSYPKQYSPSAWPYIGPFYPYPQVPLGWRRVALEWDDGWWYLDFYDKNSSR